MGQTSTPARHVCRGKKEKVLEITQSLTWEAKAHHPLLQRRHCECDRREARTDVVLVALAKNDHLEWKPFSLECIVRILVAAFEYETH